MAGTVSPKAGNQAYELTIMLKEHTKPDFSNRVGNLHASDNASVQVGNNYSSKTFHGGIHSHAAASDITRDTVLRDLASHSYKERKNVNPDRVPRTCEWFLSHARYKQWRQHPSSSMLRVSADPGCGKSVLAKYLVDDELMSTESMTTCYFFFKDGLGDQSSATVALRCLLHQILSQRSDLFTDRILKKFQQNSYLLTSTLELWEIIVRASEDANAGELIFILDAFDECGREGRVELEKIFCQYFGQEHPESKLKLILTSRPYDNVTRGFRGLELSDLPVLHLAGENEEEISMIAKEIDLVIEARVNELAVKLEFSSQEAQELCQRLSSFNNRTYLWVYLTLDVIENADLTSAGGIAGIISKLPASVSDAYEAILHRSREPSRARKLLHIVMAATRPLTLSELAVALEVKEDLTADFSIEYPPESRFRREVRDLCGLFVVIINSEVFFLHQTAREFLSSTARDGSSIAPQRRAAASRTKHGSSGLHSTTWAHSFDLKEAHGYISNICVRYLLFANLKSLAHQLGEDNSSCYGTDAESSDGARTADYIRDPKGSAKSLVRALPLFEYASLNWYVHCRQSHFSHVSVKYMLRLCSHADPPSNARHWKVMHERSSTKPIIHSRLKPLMISACCGLFPVAESLLKSNTKLAKETDNRSGRSALSFASEHGYSDIVDLLLHRLQNLAQRTFRLTSRHVENVSTIGQTPLMHAILNRHISVIRSLLQAKASTQVQDEDGWSAETYASISGDDEIMALVFEHRPKSTLHHGIDQAMKGMLVKALLRNDDRVVDRIVRTKKVPSTASCAPEPGAYSRCPEIELINSSGKKTVSPSNMAQLAVCRGNESLFRAFREIGQPVNVRARDEVNGATLLHWAAACAPNASDLMHNLVSEGVDVDEPSEINGMTPLHWALNASRIPEARALYKLGADIHKPASDGLTACNMGFWPHNLWFFLNEDIPIPGLDMLDSQEMARLQGFAARCASNDSDRQMRHWVSSFHRSRDVELRHLIAAAAVLKRDSAVLHSMLRSGMDVGAQDGLGLTLLHYAWDEPCAVLLLEHGADPNSPSRNGYTPLHIAAQDKLWLTKLLLSRGANPSAVDAMQQTPLWQSQDEEIWKTLLEAGTNPNAKNTQQTTVLEAAVTTHFSEGVRLLLDKGADPNTQNSLKNDYSPLHIAVAEGYTVTARLLLRAGADVGLCDTDGNTVLHLAMARDKLRMSEMLLQFGADPAAKNKAGEVPRMRASSNAGTEPG